jgi:starch phosphorylase
MLQQAYHDVHLFFMNSLLNTIRQGDYYLITEDFDSCEQLVVRAIASLMYPFQTSRLFVWWTKPIMTERSGLRRVSEPLQRYGFIIFNKNCNKGERQIIHNLEQMGKFSSDRAIQDYAQEYWNIESTKVK